MDVVAAIERVVAQDVGRGSEALSRCAAGSLRAAAASLLAAPKLDVAILTGFYVPAARPPAAETDGPIGAVQVAAAVLGLGGRARILTDSLCEPVLRAAIVAAGVDIPLDVGPVGAALSEYEKWENETERKYRAELTHMLAIERVGPSWGGGPPRNMRGEDISAWTAPLERIFEAGSWTRIAIGDGGNEVGMGALPQATVASVVANGGLIHCSVGCDALIVAGTSNWGAAGLVAALAVLRPTLWLTLAPLLDPSWSWRVLAAIVHNAGAADGVLRVGALSVDGLAWATYASVLTEVRTLAA